MDNDREFVMLFSPFTTVEFKIGRVKNPLETTKNPLVV